jgi:hypothetical protein
VASKPISKSSHRALRLSEDRARREHGGYLDHPGHWSANSPRDSNGPALCLSGNGKSSSAGQRHGVPSFPILFGLCFVSCPAFRLLFLKKLPSLPVCFLEMVHPAPRCFRSSAVIDIAGAKLSCAMGLGVEFEYTNVKRIAKTPATPRIHAQAWLLTDCHLMNGLSWHFVGVIACSTARRTRVNRLDLHAFTIFDADRFPFNILDAYAPSVQAFHQLHCCRAAFFRLGRFIKSQPHNLLFLLSKLHLVVPEPSPDSRLDLVRRSHSFAKGNPDVIKSVTVVVPDVAMHPRSGGCLKAR